MNQISSEEYSMEIENRFSALLFLFCLLWKNIENSKIYSVLNDGFYDKISNIFLKLIENNRDEFKEKEQEEKYTK